MSLAILIDSIKKKKEEMLKMEREKDEAFERHGLGKDYDAATANLLAEFPHETKTLSCVLNHVIEDLQEALNLDLLVPILFASRDSMRLWAMHGLRAQRKWRCSSN